LFGISKGRIFYPKLNHLSKDRKDVDDLTIELTEDLHWRKLMSNSSAAGMEGFDTNHFGDVTYICRASGWSVLSQSPQPSSRKQTRFINGSTSKNKSSALWNYGQKLEEERGVVVDSQGYATMFRIKKKDQTRIDTDAGFVDSILIDGKDIPDGISYSTNLGCIDFYPSISGKKNWYECLVNIFSSSV